MKAKPTIKYWVDYFLENPLHLSVAAMRTLLQELELSNRTLNKRKETAPFSEQLTLDSLKKENNLMRKNLRSIIELTLEYSEDMMAEDCFGSLEALGYIKNTAHETLTIHPEYTSGKHITLLPSGGFSDIALPHLHHLFTPAGYQMVTIEQVDVHEWCVANLLGDTLWKSFTEGNFYENILTYLDVAQTDEHLAYVKKGFLATIHGASNAKVNALMDNVEWSDRLFNLLHYNDAFYRLSNNLSHPFMYFSNWSTQCPKVSNVGISGVLREVVTYYNKYRLCYILTELTNQFALLENEGIHDIHISMVLPGKVCILIPETLSPTTLLDSMDMAQFTPADWTPPMYRYYTDETWHTYPMQ